MCVYDIKKCKLIFKFLTFSLSFYIHIMLNNRINIRIDGLVCHVVKSSLGAKISVVGKEKYRATQENKPLPRVYLCKVADGSTRELARLKCGESESRAKKQAVATYTSLESIFTPT